MSVYEHNLPAAFPYQLDAPVDFVEKMVAVLIKADGPCTSGSSFAVTAEPFCRWPHYRKLWLSQVSFDRLQDVPEYQQVILASKRT